jgi:hypothetical protein
MVFSAHKSTSNNLCTCTFSPKIYNNTLSLSLHPYKMYFNNRKISRVDFDSYFCYYALSMAENLIPSYSSIEYTHFYAIIVH